MLISTAVHVYVLGPIRRDWSCTVILTYRQNFWTSKTSVPRGDGHGRRAGSFKQNLLYKAWQVRPEVLPKQDELLNGLVSVVERQN